MGHRVVKGLIWARVAASAPGWGQKRLRGARAEGVRYERALARALPEWKHGVWWEFEDANGYGMCQTDLIGLRGHALVVLEAKLSWTLAGHSQLENLYLPVVREAVGAKVVGVVVCKYLRYGAPRSHGDLDSAIASARDGRAVLHWMGSSMVGLEEKGLEDVA